MFDLELKAGIISDLSGVWNGMALWIDIQTYVRKVLQIYTLITSYYVSDSCIKKVLAGSLKDYEQQFVTNIPTRQQ
jgi:hypothetical protein